MVLYHWRKWCMMLVFPVQAVQTAPFPSGFPKPLYPYVRIHTFLSTAHAPVFQYSKFNTGPQTQIAFHSPAIFILHQFSSSHTLPGALISLLNSPISTILLRGVALPAAMLLARPLLCLICSRASSRLIPPGVAGAGLKG